MLKRLLFLILLVSSTCVFGQGKYIAKNAYISFFSSTPMENILGESNEVVTILDASNGKVVAQALMTTFHFKRALMEEHFNENYMESTKFPKGKFEGIIVGFNKDMLTSPVSNIQISGQLTLHGIEKAITVPGTIGLENGKLVATSKFQVVPEEYKIEIPSLVRDKIAKQMDITVKVNYIPLEK
jgi:hypothetical protein